MCARVGGWLVVKIDASVGATQILPYYSHGSNFITSSERGSGPSNKAKVSDPLVVVLAIEWLLSSVIL